MKATIGFDLDAAVVKTLPKFLVSNYFGEREVSRHKSK